MDFTAAYRALNTEQKRAVDTIDGPVMVVAGPGTGKTQVLALRIAHILEVTDVGADAVLCLTFTRSGVAAMRARLESYIGTTARNVHISTFHSFAGDVVEKYYSVLDFDRAPISLDDAEAIVLVDQLLHDYEWEYIRPRTNPSQYFSDLKGLVSILKRERMTPAMFLEEVDTEIVSLKEDPESVSTRGESKGQLKKEIEKKIESLERTKEVVEFYRLYEEIKREQGFMDYDDVLEYAVKIVELSDDARDDIRETYQYVLIDEHQDSSGVQNAFLKAVWRGVDQPNIFVVGDDRQLIYGFSGASLSYFEAFGTLFGKAELITLSENYRSTEPILALADELLQSTVTKEKLKSNTKGVEKIFLSEYTYERDEILGAGMFFKEQIAQGVKPEQCALLVPKNRHVRSAISILRDSGLPVSPVAGASLFSLYEAQSLLRVLNIIVDPFNTVLLSESLLDAQSRIIPLDAHKMLHQYKYKTITIEDISLYGAADGLFAGENEIAKWGKKLAGWVNLLHVRISEIVSTVGNELLIGSAHTHEALLSRTEIVRSFLHAAIVWEEKHPGGKLVEFVQYLQRLEEYGQSVELASFGATSGIQVMTLHRSKGLEYKVVWVAHMNEETLMSQKRQAFTLPETVKAHINERDSAAARRELYVAITRAKEVCAISYAKQSYDGKPLELATMVVDLPETHHFTINTSEETEKALLKNGPQTYVAVAKKEDEDTLEVLKSYVRDHYESVKVSVTLLNNFFDCPWKWYFRNFLKLPEVKSVSLALGSAVHSTLEYILKSETKPFDKDIENKINQELTKEGVVDPKELKRLAKDAMSAVINWIEIYYPRLAKDRVSERSVSFKDPVFPMLLMYGKIDLTERFPDGTLSVTDFKTGSVKTAGMIEKMTDEHRLSDYMRQLAMYSYLIRGAEKGNIVTSSRLLFVEADKKEKNALYEIRISDEQIDLLVRDIKEYDEQLKSGEWINRECHHKGYGDTVECEYCKMTKMFT